MKKIFKFVVSLIICGLILLSGCAKTSSLPSELVGQTTGYPKTINIFAPDFFGMMDADNAEEAKQQWLDEMSTRYETTFNITSFPTKDGSTYYTSEIINIIHGQLDYAGLVQIDSIESLQTAIDNDVLLPLDDFLADNPIWNALPDDLKSTFKYQGHIYAIPNGISHFINNTSVKEDALAQTNATITDLASLKDFAISYTKNTGNYALGSFGMYALTDILNSFGLYCDDMIEHSFGYDPAEDRFVDYLTKDEAITALEYLRELYSAGALDIDFDYSYWKTNDQKDLYAFSNAYSAYSPDAETISLNSAYPQVIQNRVTGFIMAKDTPQPKETINLFVNMLFGSKENYLDCWLGSADNYTLNSDGTITVKMAQNADGRYVLPSTPGLIGGLSDVFPYSDASIFYTQDGVIVSDSKSSAGLENQKNELIKDLLEKGKAVKVPAVYSIINSPTFFANKSDITTLYQECIMDAITSTEYTVQQIVEQYRLDMLNMGGNTMLNEMNAAIGKQTAYYYG